MFAWSNVLDEHKLKVELFHGNLENDITYKIFQSNSTLSFPLDFLNYREIIEVQLGEEQFSLKLYVWTFTDGFTRVIRFSDFESNKIEEQ